MERSGWQATASLPGAVDDGFTEPFDWETDTSSLVSTARRDPAPVLCGDLEVIEPSCGRFSGCCGDRPVENCAPGEMEETRNSEIECGEGTKPDRGAWSFARCSETLSRLIKRAICCCRISSFCFIRSISLRPSENVSCRWVYIREPSILVGLVLCRVQAGHIIAIAMVAWTLSITLDFSSFAFLAGLQFSLLILETTGRAK